MRESTRKISANNQTRGSRNFEIEFTVFKKKRREELFRCTYFVIDV